MKSYAVTVQPFPQSDATSEIVINATSEDDARAEVARIYPYYNVKEIKEK